MSTAATTPRQLPSLTSLRWVAASSVFLLHANELVIRKAAALTSADPATNNGHTWFEHFSAQGNVGVSFFFILSGFVLAWSYRDGVSRSAFYRRRFARIYPAYLVMCVVAVPVLMAIGQIKGVTHVAEALFPVTLLQAWIPRTTVAYAGNGVSWSLSCEAFFYAVFPFVVGRLLGASRKTLFAVCAAGAAVPFVLGLGLRPTDNSSARYLLIYVNPAPRLAEFLIGIALAALLRAGYRVPWLRVGPMLVACAAVWLAAGWVPLYLQSIPLTVVPFAALIFAAAQGDVAGTTPRVLHARWFVVLGQWSYAFYLVHQLVLRVVRYERYTGATAVVACVVAYGVAIGLSGLLYRFVEHPLERRLRPGPAPDPPAAGAGAARAAA